MTESCSICYEDIQESCKIESCEHKFCYSCIDNWGKINNTCPCCRKRFNTLQNDKGTIINYYSDIFHYPDIDIDYYYYNIVLTLWISTWIISFNNIYPEKIPLPPYKTKIKKDSRYKDMIHYQRQH